MRLRLGMLLGHDVSILRGYNTMRIQRDDKSRLYKIDTARLILLPP